MHVKLTPMVRPMAATLDVPMSCLPRRASWAAVWQRTSLVQAKSCVFVTMSERAWAPAHTRRSRDVQRCTAVGILRWAVARGSAVGSGGRVLAQNMSATACLRVTVSAWVPLTVGPCQADPLMMPPRNVAPLRVTGGGRSPLPPIVLRAPPLPDLDRRRRWLRAAFRSAIAAASLPVALQACSSSSSGEGTAHGDASTSGPDAKSAEAAAPPYDASACVGRPDVDGAYSGPGDAEICPVHLPCGLPPMYGLSGCEVVSITSGGIAIGCSLPLDSGCEAGAPIDFDAAVTLERLCDIFAGEGGAPPGGAGASRAARASRRSRARAPWRYRGGRVGRGLHAPRARAVGAGGAVRADRRAAARAALGRAPARGEGGRAGAPVRGRPRVAGAATPRPPVARVGRSRQSAPRVRARDLRGAPRLLAGGTSPRTLRSGGSSGASRPIETSPSAALAWAVADWADAHLDARRPAGAWPQRGVAAARRLRGAAAGGPARASLASRSRVPLPGAGAGDAGVDAAGGGVNAADRGPSRLGWRRRALRPKGVAGCGAGAGTLGSGRSRVRWRRRDAGLEARRGAVVARGAGLRGAGGCARGAGRCARGAVGCAGWHRALCSGRSRARRWRRERCARGAVGCAGGAGRCARGAAGCAGRARAMRLAAQRGAQAAQGDALEGAAPAAPGGAGRCARGAAGCAGGRRAMRSRRSRVRRWRRAMRSRRSRVRRWRRALRSRRGRVRRVAQGAALESQREVRRWAQGDALEAQRGAPVAQGVALEAPRPERGGRSAAPRLSCSPLAHRSCGGAERMRPALRADPDPDPRPPLRAGPRGAVRLRLADADVVPERRAA